MWQLEFTRTRPWSPSTARSSRSRRTSRCCALLVPHKMSAPAVRIPRNQPHAASSSSRVRPVRPEHQAAACLELLAPIQSLDPTGSERCKLKRSEGAGSQALTGPVAGLLDELLSPASFWVWLNHLLLLRSSRLSPSVECQLESLKCCWEIRIQWAARQHASSRGWRSRHR